MIKNSSEDNPFPLGSIPGDPGYEVDETSEKTLLECKVKIRVYDVVRRAVEEGINCGWRRAHKHTDIPTEDIVIENIENEVMNALCDVINFNGDFDD